MAEDCGLANIGMLNQGIIWNNETREWKKLRQYFQNSIDSKTLKKVTMHTYEACDKIMANTPVFKTGGQIDLLESLRQVTLEVTNR